MNSIVRYFNNQSSSFPLIAGIILFVVFITVLIVVLITLISIKKAPKRINVDIPPSADFQKEQDENEKSPKILEEKVPWYFGIFDKKINQWLFKNGYFLAGPIVKSFLSAYDYIKSNLDIDIPLYLILGTSKSGKSSLLNGFTHLENTDAIDWSFLPNGVVMDINGEVFMPNSMHNLNWSIILHLLSKYRKKKPVNGVILTISAEELYGKKKLTNEEIKQQAYYVSQKLNAMQIYFGFKLPIYVVITKTDIIPGFQSFCSEIPIRNRKNMLGWSFPFEIDTIYRPNIINLAFKSLKKNLEDTILEILSANLISTMKDGVFVFPIELMSIEERLGYYINTIFSTNGYFRGIYFTGDSKMVEMENNTAIIGPPDANINLDFNIENQHVPLLDQEQDFPKRIFFFDDLLFKKILTESGLASPISYRVRKEQRFIFTAKLATAAVVTIGSYGLFNAKDQLLLAKSQIEPSLHNLSEIITESKNIDISNLNSQNTEALLEYNRQLLQITHNLQNIKLYSFFVPASWFNSIDKELPLAMNSTYKKTIIRTIYINLLLKTKQLLQEPKLLASSSIDEVIDLYKSKEYNQLAKYINGLYEVIKYANKFNNISIRNNFLDLMQFTFSTEYTDEILKYGKFDISLLTNLPYPSLQLFKYREIAYSNLLKLLDNFYNLINVDSNNNLTTYLSTYFEKLSDKKTANCNILKTLADNLSKIHKKSSKQFVFTFDKNLLYQIQELFGKKEKEKIVEDFKRKLNGFKSELEITNTKLFANNKTFNENLLELEANLNKLSNNGFLHIPATQQLITEVPQDKMLIWDSDLIQQAIDINQKYNEFVSTYLLQFPKAIRENIKLLIQNNVDEITLDLIAKSQTLIDVPKNLNDQISKVEILQHQISELKNVCPELFILLKLMNNRENTLKNNLRNVLNNVGYSLLNYIDELLQDKLPYMPISTDFSYWNGEKNVGYDIYAVLDEDELNTYINNQREIVTQLVGDFAQPIVNFLKSEHIYNKNLPQRNKLDKWVRLVNDVLGFQKNEFQNAIKLLESFIKSELNTYTIHNILKKVSINDLKKETGNYFLNIIRKIKIGLLSRAEILIRKQSILNYEKLNDFYKKYLQGSYPFSKNQKETNYETVKELFNLYDELGGTPETVLDQVYQLEDGKEIYKFMKKLHALREFCQFDKLSIKVDFHINKGKEQNVNYLVDRVFKPNSNTNIEFVNQSTNGTWHFGEPIKFELRWADGEETAPKPRYNDKNKDLSTNKNIATFEIGGKFALLRFLNKYKASTQNIELQDPNQLILEFNVPLTNNKEAKLFLGITVFPVKEKKTDVPTSLVVPSILDKMPNLPSSIVTIDDESILTNKALHNKSNLNSKVLTDSGLENIKEQKPKTSKSKKAKSSKQPKKTNTTTPARKTDKDINTILNTDDIPMPDDTVIAISEEPIG